jgi:hypothetical protein
MHLFRMAILLAALLHCAAVARSAENDAGVWSAFSVSDHFEVEGKPQRWHYWLDAQVRYFDIGSGASQWLLRPGVGYAISSDLTARGGYARFETRSRAGVSAHENRLWQQLRWRTWRGDRGSFDMRLRFEQRQISLGDDTRHVGRLRLGYVPSVDAAHRVGLTGYAEAFFDLGDTDWGGSSGLSQLRLFLGATFVINDDWAIDTGYLNQRFDADRLEDLSNHIALLHVKLRP